MTLVNQPDTLLSELRELKRRLRLLETGRRTPPAPHAAFVAPGRGPAAFTPTRPSDWWASTSGEWETVASARLGGPAEVHVHLATEGPGTTGEARLLQDGSPLTLIAAGAGDAVTVIVTASGTLTLQVRRTAGEGAVRTMAG